MILNSARLHQRRRSSMGSTISYSSGSLTNLKQSSSLLEWFSSLGGGSSYARDGSADGSSNATTTPSESPYSSGESTPTRSPLPSSDRHVRRPILPRHSTTATIAHTLSSDDSWGQFIDTAEADQELVRHSRVLSRKEMPAALYNNSSSSRAAVPTQSYRLR